MSWTMWHVTGYGFSCENIDPEDFISFCKKHDYAFSKASWATYIKEAFPELPVKKDMDIIRELTDFGTISEIIAGIMRYETGIDFFSPGLTDDGEDVVLFEAKYPWALTKSELALKDTASLYDVMRSYASELNASGTIGEYDLVYSG